MWRSYLSQTKKERTIHGKGEECQAREEGWKTRPNWIERELEKDMLVQN